MSDHVCYVCGRRDGTRSPTGRTIATRPYGKNEQDICYECMMSDPERMAEADRHIDAKLQKLENRAGSNGVLIFDPSYGFVDAIKGDDV